MTTTQYMGKPKGRSLPKVKRECLKCDREFMAEGRFNRICPKCTEVNRYLSHAYIHVHRAESEG